MTLTFAECYAKIDGCRSDVSSYISTLVNSDISELAPIANNLTTLSKYNFFDFASMCVESYSSVLVLWVYPYILNCLS